MIDDGFPSVDHGPLGTGECTFNKGIITIAPSIDPRIIPGSVLLENVYDHDSVSFDGNGLFSFQYENAASTGHRFLNVALDYNGNGITDPGEDCIVNVPFASSGLNDYGHSVYFELPSEIVAPVDVYIILEETEIVSLPPDYGDWDHPINPPIPADFFLAEPGQFGPAPAAGPPSVSGDKLPSGRANMPDIPQRTNECGPTSTANSLIWLAKRDGWENKLLKAAGRPQDGAIEQSDSKSSTNHSSDERALIDSLKEKMKPGHGGDVPYPGLNDDELLEGKQQLIKDNELPIEAHGGQNDAKASGASMFDWIKKELAKGQDIEMLIFWPKPPGGAHWVTVTDISIKGNKVVVSVVNPDDGKGTSKKPHVEKWTADKTTGAFSSPKGTAGWAVAESPKEATPGTSKHNLDGYTRRGWAIRAARCGMSCTPTTARCGS